MDHQYVKNALIGQKFGRFLSDLEPGDTVYVVIDFGPNEPPWESFAMQHYVDFESGQRQFNQQRNRVQEGNQLCFVKLGLGIPDSESEDDDALQVVTVDPIEVCEVGE